MKIGAIGTSFIMDTILENMALADNKGKTFGLSKGTNKDRVAYYKEQLSLLNLGLETLHLRVPRHCENALKVAKYLESNEKVAWVNYAGLEGNKYYDLAKKYMPNGTCGVISFGLKGGREAASAMMDKLELAAIVTHVADARTSVLHPASHTHRQMTEEQLVEAGVQPDLIRLSVGIENADDIIADLEQAMAEVK